MGVPKFYRWVSERYPCLSEVVKEFQIPEFDNLYLDMNGIVHVCSHPEDDNPHFRITEEKIFADIMYYLDFLFRMIKPQKVFFMAVDGVAPRAKMNQQRGRRFRSAREAEELEKRAREKGETLPTEKRFDSNCITPGTPFMVRLQEQLKYFVVQKVSQDPLWKGVRIYLSGHETPGEGEHKIMDFIRAERASPSYDPNTRHCLYGLDADLMMLGLATHEPHFSLLREEVRFGKTPKHKSSKRPQTPEETTFHLLHLSLFREYLDFEFSALRDKLTDFEYNLENIIDDWVLMGFLVGNDFIPHLPNLHINHDALPLLWRTYMEVLPQCRGYINSGGRLNLERFEKYLAVLSKFDFDTFSEQAGDLKWLESKKAAASAEQSELLSAARKLHKNQEKSVARQTFNQFALLDSLADDADNEELGTELIPRYGEDPSDEMSEDYSEEDTLDDEFRHHKRNYYMTKMEYETVTPEVLRDQAEGYVRGIQWILLYYYEGVPSWSWFYPHHYAPYMSDVKDFKDMNLTFDLGTPFLPFEQLMAVLPAASKDLLPRPYQSLMINDSSPVIDFYPPQFETDLNGKQQDWEAVVLIPFIDENRLLEAIRSVSHLLTAEEKSRNCHGPHLLYIHSEVSGDPYPTSLPGIFPDIAINHARLTKIEKDIFHLASSKLRKGLLTGAKLDVFYPGFPTLKHIPHKAELSKEGVKVFQASSRGYNMMLYIQEGWCSEDIDLVAKEYLGKEIYVNWPHLYEAKVVAVCDDLYSYSYVEAETSSKSGNTHSPCIKREKLDGNLANTWYKERDSIAERYKDRLGVVVGNTSILLRALPMTGRKYILGSHGRVTMEKQFGNQPVAFALQATVKDIAVHDSSFCQFTSLTDYLPTGCQVFMLGWPHYGCQGEVLDTDLQSGRVRINLSIIEEPKLNDLFNNQAQHDEQYFQGFVLAQRLGISSHLFSRLTGCVFITAGIAEAARQQQNPHRVNVGLNLKFTKRQEEVPGFTRLAEGKWLYSNKCVEILKDYMKKFPEMFEIISKSDPKGNDNFYESEVIPAQCSYKLKDVQEYIKGLACTNVKSQKTGADIMPEGVILSLQQETDKIVEINRKRQKRIKMQVKPHLLYRPMVTSGALIPDSSATYQLFDRVVNTRQGFSVPFGLRGTVVGIHPAEVEVNTMYEVLFDEDFAGGIAIRNSSMRGYRMPPSALLNLSHGQRKNGSKPEYVPNAPAQNTYGKHRNVSQDFSYADASANRSQGLGQHTRPGSSGFRDNRGGYSEGYKGRGSDNSGQYHGGYQQADNRGGNQRQAAGPGIKMVFNGASAGNMSPKFVTPKVAPGSAGRGSQRAANQNRAAAANQNNNASNSEFADMWQQLQTSVPQEPVGDKGTSLAQAAAVLPRVTSPENSKSTEASTKISVQDLFTQASKASDVGKKPSPSPSAEQVASQRDKPASSVVPKDEFTAMLRSLEDTHVSEESSDHHQVEDGSLAIKKLLQIDEEKTTAEKPSENVNPPKSYGRQVSVQELFEGANKQAPGEPQQSHTGGTTQLQPQKPTQPRNEGASSQAKGPIPQQQYHHQQQQQQGGNQGKRGNTRPAVLNPQSRGSHRNPVMELMNFCQSLQMMLPLYEYNHKNGKFFCVVSLVNGSRFQGSLCNNKEEAAESAASFALLQMRGSMQQVAMMSMPGFRPPGLPQQGRQFSSANSAFSPVNHPPGMYPPQYPRGQFSGYQQQRPHYGNQGHQQNYWGHPQNVPPAANQYGTYQQQGRPSNQHGVYSQRHAANQHSYNSQHQSGLANQNEGNRAESMPLAQQTANQPKSKPTSVVTPFVPLQVTRKHTPQKNRKESVTDDSCLKEEGTSSSQNAEIHMTVESSCEGGASNSVSKTRESVSTSPRESHTEGQTTPPKTPREKEAPSSTRRSSKKSKRRLAANFGNTAD